MKDEGFAAIRVLPQPDEAFPSRISQSAEPDAATTPAAPPTLQTSPPSFPRHNVRTARFFPAHPTATAAHPRAPDPPPVSPRPHPRADPPPTPAPLHPSMPAFSR